MFFIYLKYEYHFPAVAGWLAIIMHADTCCLLAEETRRQRVPLSSFKSVIGLVGWLVSKRTIWVQKQTFSASVDWNLVQRDEKIPSGNP